jgi:hypothetical protein
MYMQSGLTAGWSTPVVSGSRSISAPALSSTLETAASPSPSPVPWGQQGLTQWDSFAPQWGDAKPCCRRRFDLASWIADHKLLSAGAALLVFWFASGAGKGAR